MGHDALFASTVDYYVRYRPDFPARAYEAIADRFQLDGRGRLLDLGAGTGHIALALSHHFETVLAVDVSDEMLVAGRSEATRLGRTNIEWQLARAEEVELPGGSVRLVTIGNALHCMDRDTVLARCHELVEPGGGIALIDMPGMWAPTMELGAEPWLAALRSVIERHLGARRRAGDGYYAPQHDRPEDTLHHSSFVAVQAGSATLDLTWSADEVVGYLYSTSFANRSLLGDRVETFETDLRAALAAAEPSGRFQRRLEASWALAAREP